MFYNYIYRHAPIRPIRVKHLPAPWLTKEIKDIQIIKNKAKSKFKSDPDKYRDQYIKARNHCNKVCREAQRRHIHKSVENGNPAKVWKFLKSLGVGKDRNPISNSFNVNIDNLNRHFSSSFVINNNMKTNTLNLLSTTPTPDYPSFKFNLVTNCDVEKSLLSINSDAMGTDGVGRTMVHLILDIILPTISTIFNNSLSSSFFPSIWKDAHIIPLPKISKPSSFSHYRPISILPFLSKALERLVHDQLSKFLSRNDL
ncbi:uncharacterized protein LOC131845444 [Achroia grisella]|uniref:uncharacterized protein LOC131845444 n=1 Tax=Achroia grisella TaxID=688607 RepID=UPI0027D1FED7|nr:uncharacterized protein LOC131845444 [Achroia grisella]